MNRQDIWINGLLKKRGIEWTQPYGRPGYTSNPVRGCMHGCKWLMPDGNWAGCYAKDIAERFNKAYPNGFESLSFHPEELKAIARVEEPSCIFIDSMSDLFGAEVKSEWIEQVLSTIRECSQHIFISLTKNPPKLNQFTPYPDNMWVGISAPPTSMFGKQLTREQQEAWLIRGLQCLTATKSKVKWISIEPLSFDISEILTKNGSDLNWAVIGAASNGSKTFQPNETDFTNTLAAWGERPLFFKGNLSRDLAKRIARGWREEFPFVR